MRLIRISDVSSNVSAEIAPEYGGMVTSLRCDDIEVFRLDRNILSMSPMLAGGMPLMFPFPSRTDNDSYRYRDKAYTMPFHGLVKNDAFALKEATDSSATVWIGSSQSMLDANYPFAFRFEATYRIQGSALVADATVTNLADEEMFYCFGWHPYFLATDKKALKFTHHMKRRYDYVNHVDGNAPSEMDLSQTWDDVLFAPEKYEFILENAADRYRARCRFDPSQEVLVVCTTTDRSVCVEPWRGLPNSANSGRFVQKVAPGGKECHHIAIEVTKL